jgi:hypothetical protein
VRRVREEAVDDAVMCALSDEAEVYAPTLLEVAKLAFNRPLASLGLVGILESRNALRHRIERLLNFTTPRRAGVSMVSVICLAAFTALAVPMGEPPARPAAATDDLGGEKLIPYKAKVNSDVFARNLKARAEETMHTTNDDLNQILASIADGFGVDCAGERAVTFNPATGEVTAQNTSAELGVLDEVVRELNLTGGEHILNPPPGLKQLLIEAQFYLIRPDDFQKLGLDSGRLHREDQMSPWWDLSPDELTALRQRIRELGVENLSSPRIQTGHGITASLFIGDGTNNIQMECMPLVHDGLINLTALARTTGKYAPNGKGWPDFAGHTNCAVFSRMGIPDGAGVVLRADNVGTTTDNELIVLLRARVVGTSTKKIPPFLGDLPAVGRISQTQSNSISAAANLYTFTFRMEPKAVQDRVVSYARQQAMNGITNGPFSLTKVLAESGVNLNPPNSFNVHEQNGHVDLTLRATKEELRKATDVLGLNWETEQALNDGTIEELSDPNARVLQPGAKADFYKLGTNNSTPLRSAAAVSQLVQDGKVLFQLGKIDEAELKLREALASDPNNQAALYYLSLIQQVRARGDDSIGGARARNVPGPGPRSDIIRVSDESVKSPSPNLYARTNTVYTSPQRQKIYEKLNKIVFDKVSYQDTSLSEVVRDLAELTNRRDPDPQGLNFIIKRTRLKMTNDYGQPIYFDPATGAPIKTDMTEDIDLAAVKVKLDTNLTNVRLIDALEAITKSADHPITYSILDYGIEFSLKPPGVQLHTRTFKVDTTTFFRNLQSNGIISKVPDNESPTELQLAVIGFFNAIGVNLTQPKSVFFGDRQGTLTVRATDSDLELIEQAISTLKSAPAEVSEKSASPVLNVRTFKLNVNTFFLALQRQGLVPVVTNGIVSTPKTPSGQRMIQAVENDGPPAAFVTNVINGLLTYFRNNGVDLQAPKSLFYSDRQAALTVRATEKDLDTLEKLISVLNSEADSEPAKTAVTVKGRFMEVDKSFLKMLSTNGVAAATNGAQNRILTEEQFKPVLNALEKRGHADLLNEGQVTTLSGRQANFQVVDVQTIVFAATNKTPPFDTETMPFGTTLDVTAWVAADGRTIQLRAIPAQTEFLGYEDRKSGKLLKTFKYPETAFPKSRIRQTTMDTAISDGDTLMLGDLGDEWVITKPDGTSERKPVDNKSDKRLIVFVTTTIVDRAGNRVHTDEARSKDYYDDPRPRQGGQ